MKQSGVRLVQRKFAQGVPIPVSSSPAAPAPPEKRTDPPCPPRSVYHNNMSATSLLDIVALQNLHRHKQEPLVLLKRLREDEIPAPYSPVSKQPPRKRRGLKADKNKMALRSGKRKSPEALKQVANKRRKKRRSESTDDVPLAFYDAQKRKEALANKAKLAKRLRPRTEDKTDQRTPNGQESRTEDNGKSDEAVRTRRVAAQRFERNVPSRRKTTEARSNMEEVHTPVIEQGHSAQRRDRTVPSRQDSTGSKTDEEQTARRVPAAQNNWNDIMCIVNDSPSSQDADVEDCNFAFKEPTNPVRLTYKRFKEQRLAAAAKGRPLKKTGRSMSEVRSSPRNSPTQRSPFEEPGLAKRLRNKLVLICIPLTQSSFNEPGMAKRFSNKLVLTSKSPTPAARENAVRTPTTVEPSPSPEPQKSNVSECPSGGVTRSETPRMSLDSSSSSAKSHFSAGALSSLNFDLTPPTSEVHDAGSSAGSVSGDWCIPQHVDEDIDIHSLKTEVLDLEIIDVKSIAMLPEIQDTQDTVNPQSSLEEEPVRDNQSSQNNDSIRENPNSSQSNTTRDNPPSLQSNDIRDNSQSSQNESIRDNPRCSQSNESIRSSTEQYADSELETLNVLKQKMQKRNSERNAKESEKKGNSSQPREEVVEERSSRSKKKKQAGKKIQKRKGRQAAKKPNNAPKKVTRGSKAPREVTTRLTRNATVSPQVPAECDVYEFDAEREASGPPSGLRARRTESQPTPPETTQTPPSLADNQREFLTSQKTQKRESRLPSTTRDVNTGPRKKALIKNASSCHQAAAALYKKIQNYLPPDLLAEFGNHIAAEHPSGEHKMADVKNDYLNPNTESLMEALTFYPTQEEFADPILYFEKIAPLASVHGLCKIVPPAGFKPPCNFSETIRFAVIYQYISKMYSRWGPVTRELAAIKAQLRAQSISFERPPLVGGSELNLPKLYHLVERHGGLNNVMQKKRWSRVADEMKLTKHAEKKLDPLYMRYLLPYATLSDNERQALMSEVEKYWTLKYQKMLKRARNPFQRQARMLAPETENESSEDERDDNSAAAGALSEAEDCILPGRKVNLAIFKKIANTLMDAHFERKSQPPSPIEVEKAYWKAVLLGTEYIVANTASIDTGEEGYGFPKDPGAEYGTHPWNLKVLARNPNNVLRYLGQVLGVTVPTLHMSMLFSTSCWHRDPHGLPWIEYMHCGAEKIWYGIPRGESTNFRRAVETLCPAYCQNKAIWLASEITMIPPNILSEHEVRLCRLVQRPGEYVMVFPEAHSCSITTGFGMSESVYFASNRWLSDVYKLFQELRNSCEPTMFSLEQLLLNGSKDDAAPSQLCAVLSTLLGAELEHRRALERRGLEVQERPASGAPLNTSYFRAWHAKDHDDECEYCRCTLYLSKVIGLTGGNSAVCPEHALRLLETRRHRHVNVRTLEFLSSYSTRSIEEMIERLETNSEDTELIDLTTPVPMEEMEPQPSTSRQARPC